ncbi:MAG: TSUP family transporter [Actinomycetota bacterium]
MTVELILITVAAGIAVGVLSALFGVGGGLLMVPFMALVLEEGQHLAEGTSLLVIVPTAIAGVLVHRKKDFVSFPHAALLGLGGVGGAFLGARLALELPADLLQLYFGAFLALMGLRLVWNGAVTERAPSG